jgi:hypothetical protein
MKTIAFAVMVVGMLAGTVGEANAVVCRAGVYHAGCVGPHGAVVTHRAAPVRCTVNRYGRRVCVR